MRLRVGPSDPSPRSGVLGTLRKLSRAPDEMVTRIEVLDAALLGRWTESAAVGAEGGGWTREGEVTEVPARGKPRQRTLRLASTLVELGGTALPLLTTVALRNAVHPQRFELVTPDGPTALEAGTSAEGWVTAILQARLSLLHRVAGTPSPSAVRPTSRPVSMGPGALGPLAEDAALSAFQHGFLQYQRIGLYTTLAAQMHATYVADVEARLARLEALTRERDEAQLAVQRLEFQLARQHRQQQHSGALISHTFADVLGAVREVHAALGPLHSALHDLVDEGRGPEAAFLLPRERSRLESMRLALTLLESGLALEVPLKQQLQELAAREQHLAGEVAARAQEQAWLEAELQRAQAETAALGGLVEGATAVYDTLARVQRLGDAAGAQPVADMRALVAAAAAARGPARGPSQHEPPWVWLSQPVPEGTEEYAATLGARGAPELTHATPTRIVQLLLCSGTDIGFDTVVLRTFEYFMTPLELLERLVLAYCAGPSVHHSPAEARDIEKVMAGVRLRCLNALRKWVDMHNHHFQSQRQAQLLRDFLQCVRVTGHEKLGAAIASKMEVTDGFLGAPPDRPYPPSLVLGDRTGPPLALVTDVHPEELARQLCLIDQALYRAVETRELLKCLWAKHPEQAPGLRALTAQFNQLSAVVTSAVLGPSGATERAEVVAYWLRVAQALREPLHNFASMLAVVSGLNTTAVARLKITWRGVPKELVAFFQDCVGLMDKNFARLRGAYVGMGPPLIPYLGAYQRDLVYMDESPTWKGELVNLHKLRSISGVIHNCLQFQDGVGYVFKELPAVVRLFNSALLLSEDESHARSLLVEPRDGAKPASVVPSINVSSPEEAPLGGAEAAHSKRLSLTPSKKKKSSSLVASKDELTSSIGGGADK